MAGRILRILAIETSCDETSAALVEGPPAGGYPTIKTNIIASSLDLHKLTHGIVPEVAARAHVESIIPVIEQALGGKIHEKINVPARNALQACMAGGIDAIAVTVGPGLVGSLLVGVETAKALAYATGKPLIPINHLEGHIFAALQQKVNSVEFRINNVSENTKIINYQLSTINYLPALALLVSGGHTELVLIKDMLNYEVIGRTLDDAAGEAFDKVATLLGLGYPGGPAISALADKVNSEKLKVNNSKLSTINYKLPRPMQYSKDFNFSFSGLKTAVVNYVKNNPGYDKAALAYEFESAVVEVLVAKTQQALQSQISKVKSQNQSLNVKTILLTGGVSANKRLREAFQERFGDKLLLSPLELCGDNAGMIGIAGWHRLKCRIKNYELRIKNHGNKLSTINAKLLTTFPWEKVDADPNLEL